MIYKILRFNGAVLLSIIFGLCVDCSYISIFGFVLSNIFTPFVLGVSDIIPNLPYTGIIQGIIAHILMIFITVCVLKLFTLCFTKILGYIAKALRKCVNGSIAISIIPIIIFTSNLIKDIYSLFFITDDIFPSTMEYNIGAAITFAYIIQFYVSCTILMFTDNKLPKILSNI